MTAADREKPFREKYSFLIITGLMALIALYAFISKELFGLPLFMYLILLGADMVYLGFTWMQRAINAKKWPLAPATLITAYAVKRQSHGNAYKWYLEVEYEYTVSEEVYQSRNYNWVGVASSDKAKIDRLIKNLQSDSALRVRFNPFEFEESVIIPAVSLLYIIGMMFGVAVIGGGVIGVLDYFGFVEVAHYIS